MALLALAISIVPWQIWAAAAFLILLNMLMR